MSDDREAKLQKMCMSVYDPACKLLIDGAEKIIASGMLSSDHTSGELIMKLAVALMVRITHSVSTSGSERTVALLAMGEYMRLMGNTTDDDDDKDKGEKSENLH